jgi:arginyl-tRNA synthetase
MLSRKADTEFTFDIDLALKRNDENPVFYVQYAHARISSVIREFAAQGGDVAGARRADLARLVAPSETALLRSSPSTPRCSPAPRRRSRRTRSRSTCAISAAFHSYYGAERFLVDDAELARARLALLAATRQVIRNALALLGVDAPERMDREPEPA